MKWRQKFKNNVSDAFIILKYMFKSPNHTSVTGASGTLCETFVIYYGSNETLYGTFQAKITNDFITD